MEFRPHKYQDYAREFIIGHPVCALILDMGLGKTVITLTALWELVLDYFEVGKVLVIAPFRVARDTWKEELEKWDHLKGLSVSVVVGSEKERLDALEKKASVYVINRENVVWLCEKHHWDFDMIVIDELSSFKSYQAKRFKALRYKWYNKNVQKIQNKNVQLIYCYLGGKQYDFTKQHYYKLRN